MSGGTQAQPQKVHLMAKPSAKKNLTNMLINRNYIIVILLIIRPCYANSGDKSMDILPKTSLGRNLRVKADANDATKMTSRDLSSQNDINYNADKKVRIDEWDSETIHFNSVVKGYSTESTPSNIGTSNMMSEKSSLTLGGKGFGKGSASHNAMNGYVEYGKGYVKGSTIYGGYTSYGEIPTGELPRGDQIKGKSASKGKEIKAPSPLPPTMLPSVLKLIETPQPTFKPSFHPSPFPTKKPSLVPSESPVQYTTTTSTPTHVRTGGYNTIDHSSNYAHVTANITKPMLPVIQFRKEEETQCDEVVSGTPEVCVERCLTVVSIFDGDVLIDETIHVKEKTCVSKKQQAKQILSGNS